jgi:hypothetical protein
MTAFVRKNLLQINARFVPPGYRPWNKQTNSPNPPPPQPSSAVVVLKFIPVGSRTPTTTQISMTLGSDGITWSCNWDSSAASDGVVSWVVYGAGTVQSANQGQFTILANQANNF